MTFINEEKPSLEDVLEHHGVKGMRWGRRNSAASGGGEAKAPKPKKLTRAEVHAEKNAFYQAKADRVLKTALKDPQSLITLQTQNGRTIVTGREFVQHMTNGGLMNAKHTDIYATRRGEKGPYILNPNMNTAFVRSDKKK